MITLADQLQETRRELALRMKTYPGWVQRGRLTQGQADSYLEAMAAIVQTLTRLEVEQRQLSLFGTNDSPWRA